MTRIVRLAAAIVLASVLCAQAQQAAFPKEVHAAIEASKKDCGEPVRLGPKFVTSKDVNADGTPDYILDYESFQCGQMVTFFCGSGGCLTQVFVSLPDGSYVKAWDDNVREIRFKALKGKPAMILDLHGSACGKIGAASCPKTLYWNGNTFAVR